MPSQDPDELWSLRNQYHVGAFDAVFTEANSARIDDSDKQALAERDLFVQLAQLGKGQPIEPTPNSVGVQFTALEHLNALMQGESEEEEELPALKKLVEEDATKSSTLRVIAGIAFSRFGDANEALRILHGAAGDLHALHITCGILLSLDRHDLAKRTWEQMQSIDEDSTLTQLSGAWVSIASGTERGLKDASYVLEELIGKWQPTPLLVGALSCVLIHQGKFSEAEKLTSSCPGPMTADLLVNQIVAAQHEGRRLDEYIGALKQTDPGHPWF